jgi:hypothetical protein
MKQQCNPLVHDTVYVYACVSASLSDSLTFAELNMDIVMLQSSWCSFL